MKKATIKFTLIQIHFLNFLYEIISCVPFVGISPTAPFLRKIANQGRKLYIKLGPAYHIGIRSMKVPARFRVELYSKVDEETMKRTHQEIVQKRAQRIENKETHTL